MRAQATGVYSTEAAVELLIDNERWLHHDHFIDQFIEIDVGMISGTPVAFVDWHGVLSALDAGEIACSDTEAQMLRIAASLAEGTPVDLREALRGLDEMNIDIVARSVMHAGGNRDALYLSGGDQR